jgi:uncharacterized Zn-binding protein involved in type VI secretion
MEEVPEVIVVPMAVSINGRPLNFTGQTPVMVNGAPLVPLGELFRALGYDVAWNPATSTATLTRGTVVLVVREGSTEFTVNGMSRELRTPAVLMDGHMMVPFLEIIESIGGRAHRDATNTVNITITR